MLSSAPKPVEGHAIGDDHNNPLACLPSPFVSQGFTHVANPLPLRGLACDSRMAANIMCNILVVSTPSVLWRYNTLPSPRFATKRHGNSVSMNAGGLWRLRSEVKRLLQHRIHDLPELFAAKSWSKPGRTDSGAFVAAKSVHPNGFVAGTRVNRAPEQLFRLCVIPPHGLSESGPKTSC